MSCGTGPRCLVSYKRMEEKDVITDRPLLSVDRRRWEDKLPKAQFGLRASFYVS